MYCSKNLRKRKIILHPATGRIVNLASEQVLIRDNRGRKYPETHTFERNPVETGQNLLVSRVCGTVTHTRLDARSDVCT